MKTKIYARQNLSVLLELTGRRRPFINLLGIMLELSEKWGPRLTSQPESGMGYWIVTVKLKDGREFRHATIVGGIITKLRNHESIPFTEAEISDLVVDTSARR